MIGANDRPGVYRVYYDVGGALSDEIRLLRRPGLSLEGKPLPKDHPKPPVMAHSPIERVKWFFRGLDDGNPNAITSCLWIDEGNPLHLEVARLLYERAKATSRFTDVVGRRLGAEAVHAGWFYESADEPKLRALDEGTITYPKYFKEAWLEPKGWNWKLHLVRTEATWMLSADNFLQGERINPELSKVNQALERTADEIERGKYTRLRDARDAMRLRIWESREPPSTHPAE